jgi:hypothetical protein
MARLSNSFEGGTDGVTITTGNSGGASGDAWNNVALGGGGTAVYDDAQFAAGAMSGLLVAGSGATSFVEWDTSWHSDTEVWSRVYLRFDNVSLTNHTAIMSLRNAGAAACEIQLRTTNVIGLRDSGLVLRYSSSTTIAADTWYRLEWHIVHSATVGHMEARLFFGANLHGTTPDESFGSASDNWNTAAASNELWAGIASNPGTSGATVWYDEVVLDDVGWVGPVASSDDPANLDASVAGDDVTLTWDV